MFDSTIYIIGGSGFIGRHLISYFTRSGLLNVKSVGRSQKNDFFLDLTQDLTAFIKLVKKNDIVIFLASVSSPDICNKHPELAKKVNVTATLELINLLSNKGAKVIFSSTDAVFGNYDGIADEYTELNPFGIYGEMKAEVEQKIFLKENVKTVRFSYVLGEGDAYSEMLKRYNCLDKEPLIVFDGFERNIVILDDVLSGLRSLSSNWNNFPQQVFNFSGPKLISRVQLTEAFKKYVLPNLEFKVNDAPDGFWKARPKTIKMQSKIFSALLEREPMNIIDKLKNWRLK